MRIRQIIVLFIAVLAVSAPAWATLDLPLPRFVSLKSEEANIRKGPGLNYGIKYVYVKKNIPLEVIAEFEQWRKVRDIDGDEGWVHRAMLNGKRSITVTNYTHTMYKSPSKDSYPMALVEAGVSAELLECEDTWCKIGVEEQKGWIEREALWGVYPDEKVN